MKFARFALLSVTLVAFAAAAACSKKTPPPNSPEPATGRSFTAAASSPKGFIDPPDVRIEGDHLVIDQMIHFETDSDAIMDDSVEILDHIAQLLKNHTELAVLHVVGHTDSTGDDDHNMELSEKRAAAVVAALRERGVSQTMDARGAGETEPACSEDTDECHETNRRVEFIVAAAE